LRTFNAVYNAAVTVDLRDPHTFRSAFNEHHRAVYTAAFRIVNDPALAQDVVQDVFLRLWRRPEAFDPARGDLRTYLRLLGRSRALDLWREGQVRGRAAERLKVAGGPEEPRVEEHPALLAERDHERAQIRAALGKLPEPQREAVVLAYWGGLTADQIARRAQVPLGTAKSRIRLGLARLRDEFALAA
jgi:RNA polymerase sigma-70 factor (ECF subfamily)